MLPAQKEEQSPHVLDLEAEVTSPTDEENLSSHSSTHSCHSDFYIDVFQNSIQSFELDQRTLDGKAPIGSELLCIAFILPGSISCWCVSSSPMRRSKHCPLNTANAISAMFS
jgi:hypothetical protein